MVSQTDASHPSDAQLLATIHGEPVDGFATTHAHAGECEQCAARQKTLADDDAAISALLAELDDPPRTAEPPRFASRADPRWARRGLRIAIAAASLAVAAAALVVPASPVHRWIFVDGGGPPRQSGAAESPAAAIASGIAVPASRTLVIVLRHEQPRGTFEINRTVAGDVTFRSRGGITAYQVASGQVSIDNQAPADLYQVDIPPGVQQLRILVGPRVLLRWPEDSAQRVSPTRPDQLRIPLDAAGTHAQ